MSLCMCYDSFLMQSVAAAKPRNNNTALTTTADTIVMESQVCVS